MTTVQTPDARPSDQLARSIAAAGSCACVGLDPVEGSLPAQVRARHHEPLAGIREFTSGVLKAVAGIVGVVKFQSACYERYGPRGVEALEAGIAEARRLGLCVILDFKRGDIGISAQHYAAAALHAGAHWVTLSGYLGPSTIEPYLDAGLGAFVLVRTSNPDSDTLQGLALADGRSVAQAAAAMVASLANSRAGAPGELGAVVGATKASDAAGLRARMPNLWFLVPGFGAQGGTAEDIRAMVRAGARNPAEAGVVVTASRSVIYAASQPGETWECAVGRGAKALVQDLAWVG